MPVISGLFFAVSLMQPDVISIDLARPVTWEGFGTSLCWMGNAFGGRADIADALFSLHEAKLDIGASPEAVPGLGMTIARYNLGGCGPGTVEGRTMDLRPTLSPFRAIEGYWLDPSRASSSSDPGTGWDWSRDAHQRAMLHAAIARGVDRVELFSNSPMWWMCINGNPAGAEHGKDVNLRPDQAHAFATYLATVAAEAPHRWGIHFTSVEPFNEPASDYWYAANRQEGCHFDAATQARFLPILREALDAHGLHQMPIAASDETSFSAARHTWEALGPAQALVARANVHGYEHSEASRLAYATALGTMPRWNSEHGDGDGTGLTMAHELCQDLNVLRVSAWCYWQPCDGGGWGCIAADLPHAQLQHVNPKFYVLAQFTRHLRPGMKVFQCSAAGVVAAYDARHHKLVIIATSGKEPLDRDVDLTAFHGLGKAATRWRTEPSGVSRYTPQSDLAVDDGKLHLTLPPGCVETLELKAILPGN